MIIDEISTFDVKIIAYLDYRLQQAMENDFPFGGIPIIFVGGFSDLE